MKKQKYIIAVISFILFLAIALYILLPFISKKNVLNDLENSVYDSVYLTMYPTPYYDYSYFRDNIGKNTKTVDCNDNLNVISEYLDTALASKNKLESVYLGIDPAVFSEKDLSNIKTLLTDTIDSQPDISFSVLIAHPSINWWTGLSDKKYISAVNNYISVCNELVVHPNLSLYFVSDKEWLICNRLNYEKNTNVTNPGMSRKIMLSTFCDSRYRVKKDDLKPALNSLYSITSSKRTEPSNYPDYSDLHLCFFGDSVIANDKTTTAIPDTVKALTKANVYNLSVGGSPAAVCDATPLNLSALVDAGITQGQLDNDDFNANTKEFNDYISKNKAPDKQLYFFIYLGLNDYFLGNPIGDLNSGDNSYIGSIYDNIQKLKERFPASTIVLMTPNGISSYDFGNENVLPDCSLKDYADSVIELARQTGCDYINVFDNDIFSPEICNYYLRDGIHPNEDAQYIIAHEIINYLKEKEVMD